MDHAVGILLRDPVDLLPRKFILFLRSCRPWILKACSVIGSWRSLVLRILDPNFVFHRGILEILDPKFLLCREILEILDPDKVILPWNPVDSGP